MDDLNISQRRIGALDCILVDALAEGEAPKALAFICHGYGASGQDLVGLGPEWMQKFAAIKEGVRFVFPAAPMVLGMSFYGEARAWWPIDIEALERAMQTGEARIRREELPEELPARNAELREVVEILCSEAGLGLGQCFFGGFSQGSMLTTDLVLSLDEEPLGQIIFSGTLLCESRWQAAASKRAGFAIFQSHGRQDPLLGFTEAEALRELLVGAGAKVEFHAFEGQHEIPRPILAKAGEYMVKRLARIE
ncbi:MAG: phospholipase [Planctomycetes bacterium]|nr:phospholipase [Planctomycetota bacterium]